MLITIATLRHNGSREDFGDTFAFAGHIDPKVAKARASRMMASAWNSDMKEDIASGDMPRFNDHHFLAEEWDWKVEHTDLID